MTSMNGTDLRLRRIAMGVDTIELMKAAGYKSPSSISHIETRQRVRKATADRYLEALATFGAVPTVTVEEKAA